MYPPIPEGREKRPYLRIIHKFISCSGSLAMNKGFVVWQIIAGLKICNDIAKASSSTFGKTWSIQADPWFMEKLNKRDLHKKWVVAPVAFAPAQFCTRSIENFSKNYLLKIWMLRSIKMSKVYENKLWRCHCHKKVENEYCTRAIITRGLYNFYPLFEVQKCFFKGLFSWNSGLMYG